MTPAYTTRMDADAFLRAIRADPAGDLPRLVYADWLDEHGDAARAEFVRVQCELAKLPPHDERYAGVEDREHELLAAHEADWLGDLPPLDEWAFRRGFVEEVRFDPAEPPPAGWLARHAVAGVTLAPRAEFPTADAAFAGPGFEGVRELDGTPASRAWTLASLRTLLHDWDAPPFDALLLAGLSGLAGLGQLLRGTPAARNLRRLQAGGLAGSQAGYARVQRDALDAHSLAAALRRAPLESLAVYDANLASVAPLLNAAFAATLTSLDVSYNPVGPDAHREFAAAGRGLTLKHLDVSGTVLCGISLIDVLQAKCCETLTGLAMNNAGSARFNVERLAETPFWHRAEELSVHRGTVPVVAFEPLARHPGPPALRSLDLGDNFLGAEGARLLSEAAWAGPLTWLNLASNYLDDEAVRHLAAPGAFPHLRTLHLGYNNRELTGNESAEVTDDALRHLTDCPTLSRLRVLTLTGNPVTDAGVGLLMNAPHFTLSGLGLGSLDLTPAAARTLAASPRLVRLNWLDLSDNARLHSDALLPLAESPYLSPLCDLDVTRTGASDAVRELLRARLGRRLAE